MFLYYGNALLYYGGALLGVGVVERALGITLCDDIVQGLGCAALGLVCDGSNLRCLLGKRRATDRA